jgi:hypothetical protein
MASFIDLALKRIQQAKFNSTVGFARFESLSGSGKNLGGNIKQFHYYCEKNNRKELNENKWKQCFIGEFAICFENDKWPTLNNQGIFQRLEYAKKKKYSLALPWSYRSTDERASCSHPKWESVEKDIRRFTH